MREEAEDEDKEEKIEGKGKGMRDSLWDGKKREKGKR